MGYLQYFPGASTTLVIWVGVASKNQDPTAAVHETAVLFLAYSDIAIILG
jgi:hypothetical protein